MNVELDEVEARVLGCLLEKAITTPDQYPLTLNALTSACNQKSSRDPVMSLDQGEVARTARRLIDKHLATTQENFRSSVEKFSQRMCNTRFSALQFTEAEYALVCLLLLRGAQTPGELRSRSGRLFEFVDNEAVAETLQAMMDREGGALVVRLPRKAGRRDHEYMHTFFGEAESAPLELPTTDTSSEAHPPRSANRAELVQRVDELEGQVAALQAQVNRLMLELGLDT